jgi:hypothetical protein
MRKTYEILVGKLEGGYHFGDFSVDGAIILKCILKKARYRGCRLDSFGSG